MKLNNTEFSVVVRQCDPCSGCTMGIVILHHWFSPTSSFYVRYYNDIFPIIIHRVQTCLVKIKPPMVKDCNNLVSHFSYVVPCTLFASDLK